MSSPTPVALGKYDPCSSFICLQLHGCRGITWVTRAKWKKSHWLGLSKECLSRRSGYEEQERMAKLIRPDLKEWCFWRQSYGCDCVSLSHTHTHYIQPVLNYCPRRLGKWIIPSWFDKNWAAWRGSRWAVRMGPYGGTRPAPICQLRLFMRHSHCCGTWSSCPSSNYWMREFQSSSAVRRRKHLAMSHARSGFWLAAVWLCKLLLSLQLENVDAAHLPSLQLHLLYTQIVWAKTLTYPPTHSYIQT